VLDGRQEFSIHFKKKIVKLAELEERRDVMGGKRCSPIPPGELPAAHGSTKIPSQLPAVIE